MTLEGDEPSSVRVGNSIRTRARRRGKADEIAAARERLDDREAYVRAATSPEVLARIEATAAAQARKDADAVGDIIAKLEETNKALRLVVAGEPGWVGDVPSEAAVEAARRAAAERAAGTDRRHMDDVVDRLERIEQRLDRLDHFVLKNGCGEIVREWDVPMADAVVVVIAAGDVIRRARDHVARTGESLSAFAEEAMRDRLDRLNAIPPWAI